MILSGGINEGFTMAQIGYGGFLGFAGGTADINQAINVNMTGSNFQPITFNMHRTGFTGIAPDPSNTEWDGYTLTEVSDPSNVGTAGLSASNSLGSLEPDNQFPSQNDWQHDKFTFTLDTSSAAWQNLAIGESLTVRYRVDAVERAFLLPTESDSLNFTFTFTKTCFDAAALIRMADGTEKRADAIAFGDLVATADHGAQPVRWVGGSTVMKAEMKHFAQWRPIRIAAGALGENVPASDLLVSQLHRVLVTGAVAQENFGSDEVLVPARFLTLLDGIDVVEVEGDQTYVHFMFDQHEVIWANGARSESFYVSPMSRSQIGEAQLAELESLFPELGRVAREGLPTPARPFVRGDAAISLASAHQERRLPLQ